MNLFSGVDFFDVILAWIWILRSLNFCSITIITDLCNPKNDQYTFFLVSEIYRDYTSQYLIHLWIVTVLSLATFIKFYYLYKAVLLLIMYVLYSLLISVIMKWTLGM